MIGYFKICSSAIFILVAAFFVAASLATSQNADIPTRVERAAAVNGKITFESGRNPDSPNLDIYLMNPDGSGVTQLTRSDPSRTPGSAYANFGAVWSPDGARIAFTRYIRQAENGGFNVEVFVMTADGSNQINLSNHVAADENPVWSPDGAKIAFTSNRDGTYDIYVVNIDGTNLKRLTQGAAGNCGLDWSPDGSKIAFADGFCGAYVGSPPPPPSLYVVNADGGGQRKIADNAGIPLWSPDGTRILFESRTSIYVIDADGTNRLTLEAKENGGGIAPTWSPDGSAIAFVSFRRDTNGGSGIYKIKPDGSGLTKLTDARSSGATSEYSPEWSPDGTKIAFERSLKIDENRSNGEIFVMNADGTDQIRITNHPNYDYAPKWQPLPAGATSPTGGIYFEFGSGTYTVSEGGSAPGCTMPVCPPHNATITVTRKGGRDGKGDLDREARVKYLASSDILAPLGCPIPAIAGRLAEPGKDYIEARGELLFAIGEQTKTFDVQIIDDTLVETGSPGDIRPLARQTEFIFLSLDYSQYATPDDDRCYGALRILEIIDNDLPPTETEFRAWRLANRSYAYVKLSLPDQTYLVRNWGTPVRSGNRFTTTIIAEPSPTLLPVLVRVPITTANIYDLGELAPGEYTFAARITTGGDTSERTYSFTVNTAPPIANPIDDARTFVTQHYRDFLGREPDEPGLNFWTGEITSCGTDVQCIDRKRVNTSGAFFLSEEFQATGYYVYRLYKGALGRVPRYVEFLPDVRKVAAGIVVGNRLSPEAINRNKELFAREFVERAEFRTQYGALSDDAFLDHLLRTAGVRVSADERQELLAELTSGSGTTTDRRARVLARVVDGILAVPPANGGVGVDQVFETRYGRAFYEREFNAAFVLMEYFGYLRRDPDPEGFRFWLDKLNRFGNFREAEMVRSFILSAEYRSRLGQP